MARYVFGGGSDDYAVDTIGHPLPTRRVRFYTSAAMTTEITDLASDSAGTGSPLTVTTDPHGFWGPVYGPDSVTVMYAGTVDAAGNPPAYVVAVYTHTADVGAAKPRGAWTASTAYAVNDVVTSNGAAYRCLTAHTSGGTFPGVGANWEAWGSNAAYATVLDSPVTGTTYNADGSIHTITYGSGVTITYAYNADGSVHTSSDGTTTRTFTYNADGSLASVA